MSHSVYRDEQTVIEVIKSNSNEVQIIKKNLNNGEQQSIILTKEQIYQVERFLKMGVHKDN